MSKFKCSICGYVYGETAWMKWEDLSENFDCPVCNAPKFLFKQLEEDVQPAQVYDTGHAESVHIANKKNLSVEEMSAICSGLAKSCEKQHLIPEMVAFHKIAAYYKAKSRVKNSLKLLLDAAAILDQDLSTGYYAVYNTAKASDDRGELRSLAWCEKTSTMMKSLLVRYAKEGDVMLQNIKIFVCDICGFIWLGDAPLDVCPVCKVQSRKILQMQRRQCHACQ